MKIKHMIVVLFVFLSMLPLTMLGLTNQHFTNQKLESVLQNDLRVAATTQVRMIENFFTERCATAETIANSGIVEMLLSVSELEPEEIAGYTQKLLESYSGSPPFIESITILDDKFRAVACSDAFEQGTTSALKDMDPKYFSKEMKFSYLVDTNRVGSRRHVIVAIQELYSQDKKIGYLVQELNLKFFESVRVSANLFNNGTIYLTDGRGNMISAGDSLTSLEHYVTSENERGDFHRAWEERDKDAAEGFLRYMVNGEHYLTYYSGFENLDWHIMSTINMDKVLETKNAYTRLALLIAGLLAVLLLAVNWYVRAYIARPIQGMIKRFRAIRETKDYSIRMNAVSNSEIGVIGNEINELLGSIEAYVRQEQAKKEDFKKKAQCDALTGLYNKSAIKQLLRAALEMAKVNNRQIALLFLDVDNFKAFNTAYGHFGGDQVLQFIAEKLGAVSGGFAARQGGDEFVACFPDVGPEPGNPDAAVCYLESLCKRLICQLNSGLELESGETVPVHCSIGIVLSSGNEKSLEELLVRADEAMYKIKHHGKNSYCILAPGREIIRAPQQGGCRLS